MKKIASAIVAALLMQISANADASRYQSLKIADESDCAKCPSAFCDGVCAALEADAEADAAREAAQKIANAQDIAQLLKNPAEANKAKKFLKMANLGDTSALPVYKIGKYSVLIFPRAAGSRLRKGMNFLAFEKVGEKFLWNVSMSDPLLTLAACADQSSARPLELKTFSDSDAQVCKKLMSGSLPFVSFKNGALVSLDARADVENAAVAKFYHAAQESFFALKLEDYGKNMTPHSREVFASQFGAMSPEELKKSLGEYISWRKRYLKVLDGGNVQIILFQRIKDGQKTQTDTARFAVGNDGNFLLENFGAQKDPLDLFLGKYLFSGGDFAENLSKKFSK